MPISKPLSRILRNVPGMTRMACAELIALLENRDPKAGAQPTPIIDTPKPAAPSKPAKREKVSK